MLTNSGRLVSCCTIVLSVSLSFVQSSCHQNPSPRQPGSGNNQGNTTEATRTTPVFPNVIGSWAGTYQLSDASGSFQLNIQQQKQNRFSGTARFPDEQPHNIAGTVSGNTFIFWYRKGNGGCRFNGTLSAGQTVSGKWYTWSRSSSRRVHRRTRRYVRRGRRNVRRGRRYVRRGRRYVRRGRRT